ncbi:MAG: nucleotidyltransferase family protein [Verrucomicrobia bacterium]|nr:nucleotidyltransferase family protein [Verrucomicrobiota bacterium]
MAELSREQQLALACLRPSPEEAGNLLRDGIEWELLFELARSHNVLVPVTRYLASHFPAMLPETMARRFRQIGTDAIFRYLSMARQLDDVVGRFEAEQIPTLVLKGLPLGVLLHGSPLLRQTGDIDLMVRPQDVRRAWQILTGQGLQPMRNLDDRQQQAVVRFGHAFDFYAPPGKVMVDLHWGVQPHLCPLDVGKVWARAQEVTVEKRTYRTLSREDYLLFLCYHPVKHGYRDLRAVCDIAALLRMELDWDYVQREAEAAGCCRMLGLGVGLAHTLLGASCPMRNEPGIERLMQTARAGLFGPHRAFRDSPTAWGVRVLDTPRRKAAFLAHKIFVPNEDDFALWSLPERLFVGYYGLRCLRLPWRYAGIVKRLLQRQQKNPV